jgi:glycosyltransferase involved in cell wall biosynthesis
MENKNHIEKQLVILSSGDNPKTSTGYGQAWDNFLKRWIELRPNWKFYHVGWQCVDRPYQTREGYWMLPRNKLDYAFDTTTEYILTYNPDYFITMADVGVQAGYIDYVFAAKKAGWRGKWIAINPFDTHAWEPLFWDKILSTPDLNVAMADFGKELMEKHKVKDIRCIPLGVDTKTYFPIPDKNSIKSRYNLTNHFVIGFVGKNQRRKMIPYLIKGFSKFCKDKKDVKLIIHTDKTSNMGWDLPSVIAKNEENDPEIANKILFTKDNLDVLARQKIQPEDMNNIYNLMDVFCYATGGEGFGVPGIECQSCGVPLMMTDYSTAKELTGNGTHGILIPVLKDIYGNLVTEIGHNSVENAIPDDEAMAKELEKLYQMWKFNRDELNNLSKKARQFALNYDWDKLSERWISLLENETR